MASVTGKAVITHRENWTQGRLQFEVVTGTAGVHQIVVEGAASELIYWRHGNGRALAQNGQLCQLEARALCWLVSGTTCQFELEGDFEYLSLRLPQEELEWMLGVHEGLKLSAISTCCGSAAIYAGMLENLRSQYRALAPTDFKSCNEALLGVLGNVLRAHARRHLDEMSVAERYHRERVLSLVREQLGNPELDVKWIAAEVGLSTSYIHRLFASSGQSLRQWINAARLDACHRELSLPSELKRPVYAVAQDWGFSNQAHFSRAFRARFGISPSAVRQTLPACACE